MNDLMSAGLHDYGNGAIETIAVRPGMQILDLASGTGDLPAMLRRTGSDGHVVLGDINDQMLRVGRDAVSIMVSKDSAGVSDAETLPYPSESFHRVTISFGLRNATNKEACGRRNAEYLNER